MDQRFSTTAKFENENELLSKLVETAALSDEVRASISRNAADLVERIRSEVKPSLMEYFLAEYGLSTQEGVALMCLAEAMLRVPDAETIDVLIEDKIAPSDWGKHLGAASSSLVNASTWALMLTGRVLDDEKPGVAGVLRGAIKRVGEPVIRTAVGRAMREMGRQFVLGETIDAALKRARDLETRGYTYSYDMLGEAAMTMADAERYAQSYSNAIASIAVACTNDAVAENPGISIKLSALHPRYEVSQEDRVMAELVPVVLQLAQQAKAAGMGFNIDAEEQDRLVLSLKVIDAVLSDPSLEGWDGFGVVVQAYSKRAGSVLDWLYETATRLDRRIMVRLVKGAYWDTEMKLAQIEGHPDFPLFTSKAATDVSYIANAKMLFEYSDRIYPQFATHNAHTVAAILTMAKDRPFEFQRLHGMGERLHEIVLKDTKGRCRIYAPVGEHQDLLAYLVRRLLENGANSSFVHQIVDECVSAADIARDPFLALQTARPPQGLRKPADIFEDERKNSQGADLSDAETVTRIKQLRPTALPDVEPITAGQATGALEAVNSPTTGDQIAAVTVSDSETISRAIAHASTWDAPVSERARVLRHAAELYEANLGPIFTALAKEAGKTWLDAIGELREAVDFLRYYATQAERDRPVPRGVFAAISPWNFPLAIFTGQISAALAAGNGVLAKPAEQTPVIAAIAVRLLHEAGVPRSALQLLPGPGQTVGAALTHDPRIAGVVFTGSTETAKLIQASMAERLAPGAPLIAETGGLNAMIVDSTALPEQAVRDIVASAFQSAGQRCSALRCLYVQEDIAPSLIEMIKGAMDELRIGDPWDLSTDIGPVIDTDALATIQNHIGQAENEGRVLHRLHVPERGTFAAPTLISVSGISDLDREIFGPVLHVATFKSSDIHQVIADINNSGYGLTFGLHTRIDSRVQEIADGVHAGNIYVNRNQIGAVVGSQPFGGEGLSGTGPKAGGPLYLPRFARPQSATKTGDWSQPANLKTLNQRVEEAAVPTDVSSRSLPGPTGEANTYYVLSRGPILCMGPGPEAAEAQAKAVRDLGGCSVTTNGSLAPEVLITLARIQGVIWWGRGGEEYARALARRAGPIVPLISAMPDKAHIMHERHLCVDTTAAGGNAALLAG
ncbi:bifunctional proline dehydrogenase/L-glutamate gamma-semialdehyde dehydrogenase PutA [Actibacterium pelagium]|uniref:Bifunctional protein PutA n=1 Tax=Actibacterium pelagium TaxID=2029103 RepID=A0A917AGW1_9RHOB|nr:bifunctional proline dehydrogenase/L-glutamate gamma-semialdehyde dehydrogenase PutA [Actibacterium pelagium]GGE50942.1 bifunctional protein PutA [Actibacterium pelagium]